MFKQEITANWVWTFNAFPGIAVFRNWGSVSPEEITLPDGTKTLVRALYAMPNGRLRLQLSVGTDPESFPTAIAMVVNNKRIVFANPGKHRTFGFGEARDYTLIYGNRPERLTNTSTKLRFDWDTAQTPEPEVPEVTPTKPPVKNYVTYEPANHELLRQIAHTELLTPEEYETFEKRCRDYGISISHTTLPDWPPIPYRWLSLVMNVSGGNGSAWWEGKFWTGLQPVVDKKQSLEFTYPDDDLHRMVNPKGPYATQVDTIARYIARELAGDKLSAKRLSYMWQVPMWDASKYIDIESWILSRNLDYVKFLNEYLPQLTKRLGFNPVLLVTNPNARAEKEAQGSYRGRIEAILAEHQSYVLDDYEASEKGQPPQRRPRLIAPDREGEPEKQVVLETNSEVSNGATVYSKRLVASALERCFGRMPRMFGGSFSDSAIVAMTRNGLTAWLKENQVDKVAYFADQANRNFDCENFAEALRVALAMKYGLNCLGVVWGDGHAWIVCVVVGKNGPDIVMIEPKTDKEVTSFTGAYEMTWRCELLL